MTKPHNLTIETTIALCRIALSNKPSVGCEQLFASDIDWADVHKYAAKQGVAAIAWEGLQKAEQQGIIHSDSYPSKATKLHWAYNVEKQIKRYRKQEQTIMKLASELSHDGIRLMILKGYGLSLDYPTPEHRSCSDIDIWLFGKHDTANEIIAKRFGIDIDNDKHHHTVFYIDGVMIENHYDFLNINAHRSNRDIERELRSRIEEGASAITIDNCEVWRPSTNGHALFLVRHAASHFASVEIVLRHVCDWGMFVKNHHSKIDWEWLNEVCKRHNMKQFMDALTVAASDLCGFDIDQIPGITRSTKLEQRIFNDILSPEFDEQKPTQGTLRIILFKSRRWWTNRWKHRLVYNDGLISSFITQSWSHILKPKGIKL